MLRGAPSPCRPSAARSVAPAARAPTQAARRTAPAAPRAAPSSGASFALRHLATRAAPPPSGSRPQPPGRGAPKAAPQAPQQQAPPGVYTGSDFIRKQEAKPAAAASNASSSLPAVVELSQLNVEEHVMRSPVPVIVDCYADWCDPCKQLTPLLEKAVRASGGAIRLGKLNVDMHQELAQMLKVEQLPTVYAFFQGRMIDGFVGMPVDGQLKSFIDKLLKLGGTNTAKPILAEAAAMLAEGDVAGARETYKAVLKQTALKSEAQALAGLARCAMAEKDTKAAAELVSAIRRSYPDALEDPEVRQAVSAVDLVADGGAAPGGVQELEAKVKAAPADLDARLALATALFAAGSHSRAIDEALELLKRDKGWKEGAAKNLLMKIFDALGPSDPLVQKGRQRFTSILFL